MKKYNYYFLDLLSWSNSHYEHSCQNPELNLTTTIYDFTCSKQFRSFKDICDYSRSVGSYIRF